MWPTTCPTVARCALLSELGAVAAGRITRNSRLVEALIEWAHVCPEESGDAYRQAMVTAESAKSRLLTDMVGRSDMPVPPSVAEAAGRERELLAELTRLGYRGAQRRRSGGVRHCAQPSRTSGARPGTCRAVVGHGDGRYRRGRVCQPAPR